MAEAQTAPPVTGADPKQTAANIVKGIDERSNGKAPEQKKEDLKPGEQQPDPNAGKEKYRVDGRDIWLTPEQARAYVQKGIAFEPRISQLAKLEQETRLFINQLRENPRSILLDKRIGLTPQKALENILASDVGDDVKEFLGQWYYDNVIIPGKMSPDQLEARRAMKENEQFKAEKQRMEEEAITRDNQAKVAAAFAQIKAQISEAMKESGLPSIDTPIGTEMARMVADVMRLAHFQRQAITPKQAIDRVRARIKSVQAAWYDVLDEEQLVKELGEKNAEKIKKYFLKLVKQAEKEPTVSKSTPRKRGERETINSDDFHDYLDELKKRG